MVERHMAALTKGEKLRLWPRKWGVGGKARFGSERYERGPLSWFESKWLGVGALFLGVGALLCTLTGRIIFNSLYRGCVRILWNTKNPCGVWRILVEMACSVPPMFFFFLFQHLPKKIILGAVCDTWIGEKPNSLWNPAMEKIKRYRANSWKNSLESFLSMLAYFWLAVIEGRNN